MQALMPTDPRIWTLGRCEGVAALLQRGHGLKPTLAGGDHAAFVEQLRAGQFRRAKEAQAWIKQRTKRGLALSRVYALLGKAGGVLKVPRKTHAKKDAAKTEAFRQKLPARSRRRDRRSRGPS